MKKNIKFYFDSPDESPGYLLWQVTTLWQRKVKKALDKLDITHTQFVLLATIAWLAKSQKIITQVDIANHSNTDRMMVSKVLRTLQSKGHITRKEHTTDTRAKTISLTLKGNDICQKAVKLVEDVDLEFFSILKSKVNAFNSNMLTLIKQNN